MSNFGEDRLHIRRQQVFEKILADYLFAPVALSFVEYEHGGARKIRQRHTDRPLDDRLAVSVHAHSRRIGLFNWRTLYPGSFQYAGIALHAR